MHYRAALLALAFFGGPVLAAAPTISDIKLPGKAMGEGWKDPTGVAIDDVKNMKPPNILPQAIAQQYINLGVTSLANLAYRQADNPLEQVEIKIFIFSSEQERTAWTDKKYGYAGWDKHYRKSATNGVTTWDSTQVKKRIVAFKHYWITGSELSDKGNHIKMLNEYVTRLNK